ncbi:MFS transporter [Streptomyces sp. QL37]|uniref:MFS transporter n=1 Tax=Streptomyces sp. QL37 TaxID=2093747 RepID=UPI000CF2B6F7|nr:MFS transporter [Streptomyces sp. QL37]PPQ61450.1 MFS transporter [Streptomyces sp. QL37]
MPTPLPPEDLAPPSPGPAEPTAVSARPAATPVKMRKVASASFIGTVIEFYDFGTYATAAALVFANTFFPALGEHAGTVVSYATLGVAFVARPLGSILFGHFGDRLGRKRTLVATMSIMGAATVLIGLLPTAASVGVVAPVALVVLRIAQGLAAGGEWAGAALFTSEHAPQAHRGFWAMFTNLGGAFANILALGTFLVTDLYMSDETFADWGWRLPFVLSVLLVAVGLFIRLRIDETPAFQAEAKRRRTGGGLPFKDAFTHQWKEILLGAGSLVMAFSLGYIGIAFLTNYGTATLGLPRPQVLGAGMFGNLLNCLAIIAGGILTDRFGRRQVLLIANIVGIPWALVLFPLLDTGALAAFWLGISVTFMIAGVGFGVAGSFLSELFHTRYRYTAAGLSYSLAGVLGGAVPPLVAATLIGSYGGFVFGVFLAVYCLIGLICTLALRETRHRELTEPSLPAGEHA